MFLIDLSSISMFYDESENIYDIEAFELTDFFEEDT